MSRNKPIYKFLLKDLEFALISTQYGLPDRLRESCTEQAFLKPEVGEVISEVCILSPSLFHCGQLHSWLQMCICTCSRLQDADLTLIKQLFKSRLKTN